VQNRVNRICTAGILTISIVRTFSADEQAFRQADGFSINEFEWSYDMKYGSIRKVWQLLFPAVVVLLVLSACAPSVKVRTDSDPGVDLSQYQTWGFFSQLGIEGDNYSSLLGQHFRQAVADQMDARGFTQADTPQIQVNVSIGSEEKMQVNTYTDPYLYGGYRGLYGGGYYGGPWGGYGYGGTQTTVRQYTEANVYIDLVDANEHKMIWQGVATFTLTDKMQKQMRETVYNTVNKIFEQFPVPAPASGS